MDIDRDAAAGGLNGRCVVGSEGCFSATHGREGVDDTAAAAWLFDGQAAVLVFVTVPMTPTSLLVSRPKPPPTPLPKPYQKVSHSSKTPA